MILFFLLCATNFCPPEGSIQTGDRLISPEEMFHAIQEVDIVFIGEQHDDAFAHEWELFIWESIEHNGKVLALEMFETDVQEILDSYLAGLISEEQFLAESRPWSNYLTDYSPMVEFAKENSFHVIAANVPRSFAAMVARGGFEVILEEPGFENLVVDSSNVMYRERFLATMEAIGDQMHGMPLDVENMYRAQLLKDAVMASSIAEKKVVFICGSFHSDFHSGIPDQLSSASYLTVTILPEGEEYDPELADFVIVR